MNRLILVLFDGKTVLYKYYPEDGEFFGEIEFSISSNEVTIISKSEDDDTGFYARKAVSKIKEIMDGERRSLPLNFIQAWG
jgi:hypothetical protein